MPSDPRLPGPDPLAPPTDAEKPRADGHVPALLDHILDAIPQSVYWKDRESVYLGCNRSFARAVGLDSPDQIVGKTDFDLPWPRAEAEAYRADDREVMTLGRPMWHICGPLQLADGKRLWIDTTKVPLQDDGGGIVGVLGIFDDITERRDAEAEQRFRTSIIESSTDFIGMADADGRGVTINAAGLAQTGYTEEEFRRGMGVRDFQPDLPPDALAAALRDGTWRAETTFRRKDGSVFPVSQIITAVRDAAGHATAFATVARDITESQRTQQALHESERMLQLVLDAIPARVFWKSLDLTFLGCNRLFAADAGMTAPSELVGKTDYDFAWRDQAPSYRDDDRAVIATGCPKIGYEEPQTTPEGHRIWLRTSKIPLRGDEGTTIGVLGTYEDITERKLIEESLRKGEARLRSIFRASPVGIGLVSDRVLLEVNERVCEMTGYSREELVGNSARMLYPTQEEFEVVGREKYAQIRRTGIGTVETHWRCKDGRVIDVLMSSAPLVPEDHSLGVTFTALDITDRKRAEEALRGAVEGTAGATGDAFFPTLVRCLAQALNMPHAFVARLTGENSERLESIATWMDGRIGEDFAFETAGTPCQGVIDEAVVFSLPRAPEIFAQSPFLAGRQIEYFCGACLRDSTGRPIGILVVMDDRPRERRSLTESLLRIFSTRAAAELERMRSEEERRRLEAQVQHVQKLESLGVLAGGIAHDFNNLLTAILGNADLASRSLAPASPGQGYLRDIETGARRAADLCRQMLAYSGRGRFVVEPVALDEIILEMARMLEVSISKKAALTYHLGKDLPAIAADATQVRQIVMNLITNASEALADQDGAISIAAGSMECDRAYLDATHLADGLPEGTYVWVEVTDTGCGMAPDVQARMFDPFFSTKFTGRGLGMAAVLGIVRGHRGGIRVVSEPGHGTTIRVFFPASVEAARRKSEVKATTAQWRGAGTVLVVDDDETVRTLACRMLAQLGFATAMAGDGRRALEVYQERRDDIVCVLLDLTMPHMDGEEAFRELRRLDSKVRVIMSSGYNELEVTRRFQGEGLAGFIQKPYVFATLRDTMRDVLTLPSSAH